GAKGGCGTEPRLPRKELARRPLHERRRDRRHDPRGPRGTGQGQVKLVLDASFAILWVTGERDEQAVAEFDSRYHAGQVEMHAPELFVVKTANALWKHVRRGKPTVEESVTMFEHRQDGPITPTRQRDRRV